MGDTQHQHAIPFGQVDDLFVERQKVFLVGPNQGDQQGRLRIIAVKKLLHATEHERAAVGCPILAGVPVDGRICSSSFQWTLRSSASTLSASRITACCSAFGIGACAAGCDCPYFTTVMVCANSSSSTQSFDSRARVLGRQRGGQCLDPVRVY